MAVISFDLLSTLTWPNTKWFSVAQALTMFIAPRHKALYCDLQLLTIDRHHLPTSADAAPIPYSGFERLLDPIGQILG